MLTYLKITVLKEICWDKYFWIVLKEYHYEYEFTRSHVEAISFRLAGDDNGEGLKKAFKALDPT